MPDWKRYVRGHLPHLAIEPEREMEIVEELAEHLEASYQDALANGASEQEAYKLAAALFADWRLMECELSLAERPVNGATLRQLDMAIEQAQSEKSRRRLVSMESLLQDLRFGLRALLKKPGFTLVTVIILSLGIGANATIFGVVNTLLLRPLPVKGPQQLVMLMTNDNHFEFPHGMSYEDYRDYRQEQGVFSDLAAWIAAPKGVNIGGQTKRNLVMFVTGNYFKMLGVNAAAGRLFTAEEDLTKSAQPVAVIGYGCWQERFGGDPAAVGKTIKIDGQPFTVIGVAPEKMTRVTMAAYEAFVPMQIYEIHAREFMSDRSNHWFNVLGRLQPGVNIAQASNVVAARSARLAESYPKTNQGVKVSVTPEARGRLGVYISGYLTLIAGLLMALVSLVLVVACANVANLTLARAASRQKEFAIRAAFGASRWRLTRLLLIESLSLAAASSVAGMLIASWVLKALIVQSAKVVESNRFDFSPDWRVFGYTFVVTLGVGLFTGLAQAMQASKPDLNRTLKECGEVWLVSPGRHRLRSLLVVTQVAMTLLLLLCAGLFIRSARHAREIDPGFRTRDLMLLSVDQQAVEQEDEQFYQRLLERTRALPGVRSASLASAAPFGAWDLKGIFIEGKLDKEAAFVFSNTVGLDYFRTMEIPVLRGRDFKSHDVESSPRVAIINQTLAEHLWPGQEPLGKRFRLSPKEKPLNVIGVARNHKILTLGEAPRPAFFMPLAQNYQSAMTLHLHTIVDPASLMAPAQRIVRELNEDVAVYDVQTIEKKLNFTLGPIRGGSALISAFGILGLLLAAVGLYGLVSFSVTQRTHEVGVRMALGARSRDVVMLIIRQGVKLAAAGVVIGLLAALGLTRLIQGLLYGVSATDPVTYLAVVLLLAVVVLLACYIPARRAAKVDPLVALRHE